MTKDRDYYRSMSTADLCEQVSYAINPDWQELAIALAERLAAKNQQLTDYRYDLRAERSEYE